MQVVRTERSYSHLICDSCGQEEDLPVAVARRCGWQVTSGNALCQRCSFNNRVEISVHLAHGVFVEFMRDLLDSSRQWKNEQIVKACLSKLNMSVVAKEFGLTRERVRQILLERGITGKDLAVEIRRRAQERRLVEAPRCPICHGPNLRKRRTCSFECAEVWNVVRLHLDPVLYERHRLQSARSALKHPEHHSPSVLALAAKVVAGDAPPPNRSYVIPTSKAADAIRKYGLDIPIGKGKLMPCPAINLNGTPCSRTALPGEMCHIRASYTARIAQE